VCAQLHHARVLELGAGVGASSIVCALCGAEVTATDIAPRSLALTRANAAMNGARVGTGLFDWLNDTHVDGFADQAPWDFVVGAALQFESWADRMWDVLATLAGCTLAADDSYDAGARSAGAAGSPERERERERDPGAVGGRCRANPSTVVLVHTVDALHPPRGSVFQVASRTPGEVFGMHTAAGPGNSDFEVVVLRVVARERAPPAGGRTGTDTDAPAGGRTGARAADVSTEARRRAGHAEL